MTIKDVIKLAEKSGDYNVLDIYDYEPDYYLVSCENSKTKSRLGDFFLKIRKDGGKVLYFNPAADPFDYGDKIKKAKVLYSS